MSQIIGIEGIKQLFLDLRSSKLKRVLAALRHFASRPLALRHYYEQTTLKRLWPVIGRLTLRRHSALGDELLLTAVAREIKKARPRTRLAIQCSHPELFAGNPHIDEILTSNQRLISPLLMHMNYEREFERDRNSPRHIVELLCSQVGVACGDTRPEVFLSDAEAQQAEKYRAEYGPYLTLSTQTSDWSPNKLWSTERWQAVVDRWSKTHRILHLGLANEPKLARVTRFAGKTSIRECFTLLKAAQAHLGVVSFLMHAARSVGTPSVVVYGGYESPSTSSYPGDAPLFTKVECAPCWRRDTCPHDLKCMRAVTEAHVSARLENIFATRTPR